MRQVYAHEAVLTTAAGADPRAAVAAALGDRRPHHSTVTPDGDGTRLRILFAADPVHVDQVRSLLDQALSGWRPARSGCSRIEPGDREAARRLLRRAQG